ncbi:MAG: 4Fe-4S binding protein [Clostridia bacterium]|nr:4Fe-4S binding protein [[Bacteroides] pectinophilus]MDD5872095.1 4Fe-4S binding protein [Clostridia bacterium]
MIRKIITIDEDKCTGCGACANACHEGAIGMVDGKAKLLRDDYCDGLGDCLPACPADAISFTEREAACYDAKAVEAAGGHSGGSKIGNWPVQIKLAPISAPYFSNADLLIAADCTAYAHANFHNSFMANRITLIGCPKLDMVDYSEKLTAIFSANEINSITVARMEVPCCGGIEYAVKRAIEASGKDIALRVMVISINGQILY